MVSFDLDGTLLRDPAGTTLAERLGIGAKFNRYDELLHQGQITKRECLRKQFALFRGVHVSRIHELMRSAPRVGRIRETVKRFKSKGLMVVVLSDNPTIISDFFLDFGFDRTLGSKARLRGGVFMGNAELVDQKLPPLRRFCRSEGIPLSECIHVGDWINDIPVFKAVGLSVALNPKNGKVARNARLVVRTHSLLDVYRMLLPFITAPNSYS